MACSPADVDGRVGSSFAEDLHARAERRGRAAPALLDGAVHGPTIVRKTAILDNCGVVLSSMDP